METTLRNLITEKINKQNKLNKNIQIQKPMIKNYWNIIEQYLKDNNFKSNLLKNSAKIFIFYYKLSLTDILCKNCNKYVRFISFNEGFKKFCSKKCEITFTENNQNKIIPLKELQILIENQMCIVKKFANSSFLRHYKNNIKYYTPNLKELSLTQRLFCIYNNEFEYNNCIICNKKVKKFNRKTKMLDNICSHKCKMIYINNIEITKDQLIIDKFIAKKLLNEFSLKKNVLKFSNKEIKKYKTSILNKTRILDKYNLKNRKITLSERLFFIANDLKIEDCLCENCKKSLKNYNSKIRNYTHNCSFECHSKLDY